MTDNEKLQRAKMFLLKMAQGIDPISGEAVPDTDCIRRQSVSNCLLYVARCLDAKTEAYYQTPAPKGPKKIQNVKRESPPAEPEKRVKPGCVVETLNILTGEKKKFKLLPSRTNIRYTSMGYKTKNYAELYLTSDADGTSSVSEISPLGKAVLNKTAGETITFSVNGNVKWHKILSVE